MPPIGPTTNTTRLLAAFAILWLFAATATLAAERVVDVRDCGAVGDGKTLATEAIYQRFLGEGNQFKHGSTANGHPVCAAVGLRNIDILVNERLPENGASKMG